MDPSSSWECPVLKGGQDRAGEDPAPPAAPPAQPLQLRVLWASWGRPRNRISEWVGWKGTLNSSSATPATIPGCSGPAWPETLFFKYFKFVILSNLGFPHSGGTCSIPCPVQGPSSDFFYLTHKATTPKCLQEQQHIQ